MGVGCGEVRDVEGDDVVAHEQLGASGEFVDLGEGAVQAAGVGGQCDLGACVGAGRGEGVDEVVISSDFQVQGKAVEWQWLGLRCFLCACAVIAEAPCVRRLGQLVDLDVGGSGLFRSVEGLMIPHSGITVSGGLARLVLSDLAWDVVVFGRDCAVGGVISL